MVAQECSDIRILTYNMATWFDVQLELGIKIAAK